MSYKRFFVSKSDTNRVAFVKDAIKKIRPDHIYILCENRRAEIYNDIDAVVLPIKDLNKNSNWIKFVNTFTKNSLLVIDNILKFVFFGDGKKKYLKDISQSISNIIVTDVVPFYTEPHEIFYPFWFLGKEILGYNSYNTFKANHLEEHDSGEIFASHSFDILRDKIKDYYIQDYKCFFTDRTILKWRMSENSLERYKIDKISALDKYDNPIKMKTAFADYVNLLKEKADVVKPFINGKTCLVLNYAPYEKKVRSFFEFEQFDIISYHDSSANKFEKYKTVIFYDNIIVKPHALFYIEPHLKGSVFNLIEESAGIDKHLYDAVYNIELRSQFDNYFYE